MIAALHKFDKSARIEIVDNLHAPKLYNTIILKIYKKSMSIKYKF